MTTTDLKKIYAQIEIKASSGIVWKVLTSEQHIYKWCKAFTSFSLIDSSWGKGDTVTYISSPGVGLIGKIVDRNPNLIVIEYIGILDGGLEITDVAAHAVKGKGETYKIEMLDKMVAMLSITADIDDGRSDTAQQEWNVALELIKQLAESLSDRSIL